jgi:hypothetical protein
MNINKILTGILVFVVVGSIALGSLYLYTRFGNTKNNQTGIGQNTPNPNGNQNNSSSSGQITPFIAYAALPQAKVGTPYTATVEGGVKNVIAYVSARVDSGMPPGLQLTSCQVQHPTPDTQTNSGKYSTGICTIGGTPKTSGNFKVRIYFSAPGLVEDFFSDYPLVVTP